MLLKLNMPKLSIVQRCEDLMKSVLFLIDKLARLIEDMNERFLSDTTRNITWSHALEYLPPFFCPKDLETVFTVRCKLREIENRDSFDENLKGFPVILSLAVV